MTVDAYRHIARWYDVVVEPSNRGLRSIGLAMYPPTAGMKVLDVGCGTGTTLSAYADAGCACHGMDLSEAMLARARARLGDGAVLVHGDASVMPYEDDSFDLVMASTFLHELSPDVRTRIVGEMVRVVAGTGRVLIIDFAPGRLAFKGRVGRGLSMVAERVAGKDHHRNCRTFLATGGMPSMIGRSDLEVDTAKVVAGGNMGLYLLRLAE